jgi:hypothetical protein
MVTDKDAGSMTRAVYEGWLARIGNRDYLSLDYSVDAAIGCQSGVYQDKRSLNFTNLKTDGHVMYVTLIELILMRLLGHALMCGRLIWVW